MTLQELETALDAGQLECQWNNGRWYAVRRNGATKRWKRDPSRFRIPCKTGFRNCFSIGSSFRDGTETVIPEGNYPGGGIPIRVHPEA